MRRLTDRLRAVFPGDLGLRSESGAVIVFVAIVMVVLLGAVALSVDVGRIYSERRELQNGADAAALAVAYDCAAGDCGSSVEQHIRAEEYADANASDGLAWADDVTVDLGAQTVRVHAATEDPGGDHFFDTTFAQVIGFDGLTVGAEATVAWGSPKGLKVLPIIFSTCEAINFMGDSQPSSAVLDGSLPSAPWSAGSGPYPADYSTIFLMSPFPLDSLPPEERCHDPVSGFDLPGGFGWLDSTNCSAEIDTDDMVGVDTGVSPGGTGCSTADFRDLLGTVVLVPYFDSFTGSGTGAEYHVAGFGALYLTGYEITGGYKEESWITGEDACSVPKRCIEGYFIDPWLDSGGGDIGGRDFGVVIVKFVK